jgi:hypothetical protein
MIRAVGIRGARPLRDSQRAARRHEPEPHVLGRAQANALAPVMSRPTINVWMVSVPSNV